MYDDYFKLYTFLDFWASKACQTLVSSVCTVLRETYIQLYLRHKLG